MTRGLQRATFNRSALVRLLSEVAPETSDPKYDFGERLGQWLDFSDALTLSPADIQADIVRTDEAQKWLEGKAPKKIIVVPGKIINIVI